MLNNHYIKNGSGITREDFVEYVSNQVWLRLNYFWPKKEKFKNRIDLLLDINKTWFSVSGSDNYTLFISPVATGLAALFGIFIPLLIQRHEAMGTLAMSVVSELYRNLSEFEYMQQQFEKDYFEQEPDAEPTEHNRQSMEMGKIIGAAQRLDSALEDIAYRGIMNSRELLGCIRAYI